MSPLARSCPADELPGLVYELLDAHSDTVALRAQMADELAWEAHLDYLRALQRTAREMLARSARPAHRTSRPR